MLGDVAGIIAAVAFVALVALLAVPLLKLGRVLDETRDAVRDLAEHTVPILDEAAGTVAATTVQLERVDTITTSAAEVTQNVSALTSLFAATVGAPMVKVAAFSYGVRQAVGGFADRLHGGRGHGGREHGGRGPGGRA